MSHKHVCIYSTLFAAAFSLLRRQSWGSLPSLPYTADTHCSALAAPVPPAWAVSSELSVQSSVVLYPFSLDVLNSCGLFQDSKTQACEGAVFICHTRAGGEQPWWAQAGPGRNLFCSSAVAVLREGWCRACLPLHTRLVVGQHVVLPWPSFRCLSGWAGRASWPCCTCCAKAALWSTWLLSWALQWEAFVLADVPHGLNVWVSVKSGG